MSYDIRLVDSITGQTLEVAEHHMHGGTYQVGGSTEAHLNITYNYSEHYTRMGDDGIRTLYGMSGVESLPLLARTIASLGEDTATDYWKSTEGNAKVALLQLKVLALMRPDGVWRGD